jgi:xylulokinase
VVAKAELTLTIDGGGTSVKVSAYSIAAGCTVAGAVVEYSASFPSPELAEFDPASWWEAVMQAIRETVDRASVPPSGYSGVTCVGMRIPFVLLDGHREALGPGILNIDRRGQSYLHRVRTELGPERLYQLTGHWPNAKFGLPKLLWFVDQRPELWRRTRHVLQFHDWLVFELSGQLVSEPSSAAMSQLVDVHRRDWADELLGVFGLDRALFPQMVDAGTHVGGLAPTVARQTGLLAGMPVYAGGGDSHVSAFGAGGARTGDISIIGGSTTPVMLASAAPLLDPAHALLVSPHLRPQVWAVETNAGTTGILYKWLRDLVPLHDKSGQISTPSYAAIDDLAASSPLGSRDLMIACANPFWGEDSWERLPPISIVGLTPGHSIGDVGRAILECACYAIRGNFEALEAGLEGPSKRIIFSGGTSRSSFASQMLADVIGRTVMVAEVPEPSAVAGAFIITGEQIALGPDYLLYEPDSGRHSAYDNYANRYRGLFGRLQDALG